MLPWVPAASTSGTETKETNPSRAPRAAKRGQRLTTSSRPAETVSPIRMASRHGPSSSSCCTQFNATTAGAVLAVVALKTSPSKSTTTPAQSASGSHVVTAGGHTLEEVGEAVLVPNRTVQRGQCASSARAVRSGSTRNARLSTSSGDGGRPRRGPPPTTVRDRGGSGSRAVPGGPVRRERHRSVTTTSDGRAPLAPRTRRTHSGPTESTPSQTPRRTAPRCSHLS